MAIPGHASVADLYFLEGSDEGEKAEKAIPASSVTGHEKRKRHSIQWRMGVAHVAGGGGVTPQPVGVKREASASEGVVAFALPPVASGVVIYELVSVRQA